MLVPSGLRESKSEKEAHVRIVIAKDWQLIGKYVKKLECIKMQTTDLYEVRLIEYLAKYCNWNDNFITNKVSYR